MSRKISRRTFLKATLTSTIGLSTAGAGGYLYGTRIEPYDLDITQVEVNGFYRMNINLPQAFQGFTIAQISDLHLGSWMTAERMAVIAEEVNKLNADIIVITGDFVQHIHPQTPQELTDSLKLLHAPEGVYACLGNHDHWTDAQVVTDAVRAARVNLLVNAHHAIQRGEDTLYIAGVDDIWENKQNLRSALDGIPQGAYIILLAHEPDFADRVAVDGRVSLQLSGHSHGGQIRIPLHGSIVKPYLAKNYDMGLYNVQETMTLYVNRGVGMIAPHIRINCNPEITLLRLINTY